MIYPDTFEQKTGFSTIRDMLMQRCLSDFARNIAVEMGFVSDYETLQKLLGLAGEMQYLIRFQGNFPAQDYYDLTEELQRIRIPGTYTEPEHLIALRLSLIAITDIVKVLQHLDTAKFPFLSGMAPAEIPPQWVIHQVEQLVDEKGEIRDKASEKLHKIRKEINNRASGVDRRINQILTQARRDGLANDDAELTIRNGRLVIPLPAGNKRKLGGYVHDTSATGQTVFIEPAEVFEINNEIQNLRIEERQEIIQILIAFTDALRPSVDEISEYYRFLGEIDFIRAKALLAIEMGAVKPSLSPKPLIIWQKTVHPLLARSLRQQGRTIVDQDISLDTENRIMIISGPNAGGKSVTLKTAGLLQYMLQCGLLIPVHENSSAGIFQHIFMEIGDEQSLENDLSTYSSHLIHIRYFLENSDKETLILIDEFGAGTEPQLGGAMAEASLTKLNKTGCFGIITTHYTNLKLMADNHPGVFNAAMLYDTQAMHPMFKLSPGKPGSSFAFEIARKIGFPEDVLNDATTKIGHSQLDFERQLAQLEVDKKRIDQQKAELKVADETLASLVNRYETLFNNLENRKHELLKEAKTKAQNLLDNSNRAIENTIRGIRENNAEKEVTRKLREKLSEEKDLLLNEITNEVEPVGSVLDPDPVKEPASRPIGPVRKGSFVKIGGQETVGKVEDIRSRRATVQFGSLMVSTNIEKLVLATPGEIRIWEANQRFSKPAIGVVHRLNDKMAEFKMSIDIRGKKAEEAHEMIARYIDQAILLRVPEVRILHGKGDGVLRNILHAHLRDMPEVSRYEDESLERGGHGITLVYFS